MEEETYTPNQATQERPGIWDEIKTRLHQTAERWVAETDRVIATFNYDERRLVKGFDDDEYLRELALLQHRKKGGRGYSHIGALLKNIAGNMMLDRLGREDEQTDG